MAYHPGVAEHHRATLELGATFTEPELRLAYRRLIRSWHPDRQVSGSPSHLEATEKAKLINVAYEYLSEYLEASGTAYSGQPESTPRSWNWSDLQPKRRYDGKNYTGGFGDPQVTEVFLKSSHLVSTGYNRVSHTLFIKFSSGAVYRYYGVPEHVFESFLGASSYGKFANQHIYHAFRYERC